jgi:hypothetical protein
MRTRIHTFPLTTFIRQLPLLGGNTEGRRTNKRQLIDRSQGGVELLDVVPEWGQFIPELRGAYCHSEIESSKMRQ